MKHILKILAVSFCFLIGSCKAPKAVPVVDYTNLSLFIEKHKNSHSNKTQSRDNQAVKTAEQKVLSDEVNRNRKLQETLKKRFTETKIILTQVPKLPRLLEISKDIKEGQAKLLNIVNTDPKLLPFVLELEANTLRRINSLIDFFNQTVLIGTDLNQISLAKRLKTIDSILFELTKIKVSQAVAIRKLQFINQQNYVKNLLSLTTRINQDLDKGINRNKIVEDALPKFKTGLEDEEIK